MSELSAEARRLLEAIDGVGGPTRSQRALMKRAIALSVATPIAAAAAAKVGAANWAASALGTAQAGVSTAGAAQAGAALSAGASSLTAAQSVAASTAGAAQAGAALSAGASSLGAAHSVAASTAGAAGASASAIGANAVGVTGQAGAGGVAAGSTALLTGVSLAWVKLLALGLVSSAVGAAATWQVLPPRAPAAARPAAAHATTTPASAWGRSAPRAPSVAPIPANAKPPAAAPEALEEQGSPSQPVAAQVDEPLAPGEAPSPPQPTALEEQSPPPVVPSAEEAARAPPSEERARKVEGSAGLAAPTRAKRGPPARLPEGAHAGPSRPSANAVEDAPLGRELGTVAGAMAALDAKRYTEALETVTRYRETFPTGALITEASVLEVLALCGLGRRDEAQRAAAAIGASESNNPAVRRLARSCVDASQWTRLPAPTQ